MTDTRWDRAAAEHRAALRHFSERAGSLDPALWTEPRAEGKWSPAQIAEHLVLGYEALLRELAGEGAMRMPLPLWRSTLLRWVLLPHILYHRTLPLRARSPREMRPSDSPADRGEALRRLAEVTERFERALETAYRAGGGGITHPYFGRVRPVRGLRFLAVHVEHHTRQLPGG
ncbi:MAG TPA: DinB family protein [Longimicrobiaceae bacterium]